MSYFVYVLLNPEGKLYIGQTNNLDRRLFQHNDPDSKGSLHTKRHKGPWRLVYQEEYPTRSEAMKREIQLKTFRGRESIRKAILEVGGC